MKQTSQTILVVLLLVVGTLLVIYFFDGAAKTIVNSDTGKYYVLNADYDGSQVEIMLSTNAGFDRFSDAWTNVFLSDTAIYLNQEYVGKCPQQSTNGICQLYVNKVLLDGEHIVDVYGYELWARGSDSRYCSFPSTDYNVVSTIGSNCESTADYLGKLHIQDSFVVNNHYEDGEEPFDDGGAGTVPNDQPTTSWLGKLWIWIQDLFKNIFT